MIQYIATTVALLALLIVQTVSAEVYYIGNFSQCGGGSCNSCSDDSNCGPAANDPCCTLSYFTTNRRASVTSGDTIRLTGTHTGTSEDGNCVIIEDQAVTIEGRTSNDSAIGLGSNSSTSNWDSVKSTAEIDHNNLGSGGSPCYGAGIIANASNFNGVTIKGLSIQNVPSAGSQGGRGTGIWLQPGNTHQPKNWSISNVVVEGNGRGGVTVTNSSGFTNNNCTGGWDATLGSIKNSRISNNPSSSGFGGLNLSCVRDVQIFDCEVAGNGSSNDEDGFKSWCGQYLHVKGVVAFDNGEDDFDWGGHWGDNCSQYNFMEQSLCKSGTSQRCVKLSGGLRYLSLWNNYLMGNKIGFGQCSTNIEFVNNTVVSSGSDNALQAYEALQNSALHNNLVVCDNADGPNECIYWDTRSTDLSSTNNEWDYNSLWNDRAQESVFRQETVQSPCLTDACSGRICSTTGPAVDPPQEYLRTELSDFQDNDLFGAATASNDSWGSPSFNGACTEPSNCQLTSTDSVARNQGMDTSSLAFCDSSLDSGRCTSGKMGKACQTSSDCVVTTDYFGNTRTASFDIGAHEQGSSAVSTTTTTAPSPTITTTTTSTTITGLLSCTNSAAPACSGIGCPIGTSCTNSAGTCSCVTTPSLKIINLLGSGDQSGIVFP